MTSTPESPDEKTCAGYLRQPHNAPPVLFLQYPDGTKIGLCQICATRWLLSEEEWPPQKITRSPSQKTNSHT